MDNKKHIKNNSNEKISPNRQRIIDAAATLFSKQRNLGTSLNDIAKEANLNKATIYYYFESKADILFEITHIVSNKVKSLILPTVKDSNLTAEQKLQKIVVDIIDWQTANVEISGIGHLERVHLPPKLLKSYIKSRDEFESLFYEVVQELAENEKYKITDTKFVTMVILGMMTSVMQWYKPEGRLSGNDVANFVSDFICNGLTLSIREKFPAHSEFREVENSRLFQRYSC